MGHDRQRGPSVRWSDPAATLPRCAGDAPAALYEAPADIREDVGIESSCWTIIENKSMA